MMHRERMGHIKIHYHSGQIVSLGDTAGTFESRADVVIAALPLLAEGSFYAFHADFIAPDHRETCNGCIMRARAMKACGISDE